jgi:hypothetical protein
MATTKAGKNKIEDFKKAGLAGCASVVAAFCTHPVDTMKIKMQLQPILEDGTKKYPNMIKGAWILG